MKQIRTKAIFIALGLSATLAHAANSNIYLFNDSATTEYYLVQDEFYKGTMLYESIEPSKSDVITFKEGENHSAGRIYISDQPFSHPTPQPGIGDHYNLVEYTIGNENGHEFTDFDFSAVDSLDNIPITIEAVALNGSSNGWVGMNENQTIDYLTNQINSFIKETNWPTFSSTSTKIPGAYNLFVIPTDQLSSSAQSMRDNLEDKWKFWTNGTPEKICHDPLVIKERSMEDCEKFAQSVQKINDFKPISENLAGLYGFVSPYNFNDSPFGPIVTALLRGLADNSDQNPDHIYPQYKSMYSLDPYVSFIHRTDKLDMHVYAFSIDDSIGNVYEPGIQNLYIDVGSHNNIPVKTPYGSGGGGSSSFNLYYGPNWADAKVTIGKKEFTISGNQGDAIGFNKDDFIDGTLDIKLIKNQLNFTSTIKLDKDGNMSKSECELTSFHDDTCSNFNRDWLGAQMNIDNTGHAIDLPGFHQ